jgi:hypothetical protein
MKHRVLRTLSAIMPWAMVFGLANGQSNPDDGPARFLENPEVRAAVEADTPLISVPLQSYGAVYLVDVTINRKGPFKFIIDSGTARTVLDSKLAEELGLSEPAAPTDDAGKGAAGGPELTIESLTLGSARFVDLPATVRDLDGIWGEGSPSGVLGFSLFGDRLVTLDLPLHRLVVKQGQLPDPDGREVLSFAVETRDDDLGERRIPTIEIQAAGRNLKVELNPLGFGTLTLPKDQADRFPLEAEPGTIGQTRTPDGVFPILGASLKGSLEVGNHRFENPSVFFSEAFEHPSLGSGTLEPFVLTFDLAHQRVRVELPTGRANPLVAKASALRPQTGEGSDLRSEFNENRDKARLMVLLSPT